MPCTTFCPHCGDTLSGELPYIREHILKCGGPTVAEADLVLSLSIKVDRKIQSQNVFQWASWRGYSKEVRKWRTVLQAALVPSGITGSQFDNSSWVITRVYGGTAREYDLSNLVGGAKPILDVLIKLGVIVVDNPQHFQCTYAQERVDYQTDHAVITLLEIL